MEIKKDLLSADKMAAKPADENKLGFGKIHTDHMFVMKFERAKGWIEPVIKPYGPFVLDPAALVLHYSQEVFEGLKAYRGKDGGIYMFRPRENAKRMARSCERLCMPPVPEEEFLESMFELVRTEKDWIPSSPGTSLYVRPTMIGTEAHLGVKVSDEYLFFIIVGPVGPYYPEGFNPTKIYVEESYVRAAPGGTGNVKTGGNYAASLLAFRESAAKGYTQVLWLDACEKRYIEEVGTSNMMFVMGDELITAPLGGTILPGVTRDSVLELAREWGINVVERKFTIDEVIEAQKGGYLKEAFGTGTAAVVSPVGSFRYKGEEYQVGDGKVGALAQKLYDEITGIQVGERPDPFGWVVKIA